MTLDNPLYLPTIGGVTYVLVDGSGNVIEHPASCCCQGCPDGADCELCATFTVTVANGYTETFDSLVNSMCTWSDSNVVGPDEVTLDIWCDAGVWYVSVIWLESGTPVRNVLFSKIAYPGYPCPNTAPGDWGGGGGYVLTFV